MSDTNETPRGDGGGSIWRIRSYPAWFGQASTNQFASSAWIFFLPLVAMSLTDDHRLAGGLLAVATLISTVASLPGGVLVDRINRRSALILYALPQAALWAIAGGMAALGVLRLEHLFVIVGAVAFVSGLLRPASNAMLRSLVPKAKLPNAIANNQARDATIELSAAPIAGALLTIGNSATMFVTAGLNLVAGLLTFRIDASSGETPHQPAGFFSDLISAAKWLGARQHLLIALIVVALGNLALTGTVVTVQLALADANVSTTYIGLLFSATSVGMILGSILTARYVNRLPVGRVLIGSLLILAACVASITLLPLSIGPLLFPFAILGLVLPFTNAGLVGWIYSIVPESLQGRINSVTRMLDGLAMSIASYGAGLLLTVASPGVALCAFTGSLIAATALALASPRIRALGRPDSWDENGSKP